MFDKINKFETKSFHCELNITIVNVYVSCSFHYNVKYTCVSLMCLLCVWNGEYARSVLATRCSIPFFRMEKIPFPTLQCFVLNGLGILYQSN